ncbi:transketolase C-terminal domain-containing protein [Candidatus Accumulibacter sp. ACC003]|uniref:transketolase-like TK C-terminal-containing protein n=1 Tax=Candidatus Accumulibacter sp. ACC003 TaxID=2823334 RepID=UPI0025BA07B1|nr:transketolase C-terminal domain-containing protein [Candidatus Accumulibacter sp. ACC003]
MSSGVAPDVIRRGAYVLADCADPQALLIATGSEVKLALDARQALADEGIAVRVVSMPCAEVFDRQDGVVPGSSFATRATASGDRSRRQQFLAQVRRTRRRRYRHRIVLESRHRQARCSTISVSR